MRVIMLAGIIYFSGIELYQAWKFGFFDHFSEFWNWVYFLIYALNLFVIINNVYGGEKLLEKETAAKTASVVVMLLWIGLFYWLRLFERYSSYTFLIIKTFEDI